MKKCLNVIGILSVLLLFSYCGKKEASQIEIPNNNAYAALAEIDSLMWRQPGDAFDLLQQFAASPQADSLGEFDGHYCQLLISELLYKNYQPQTNRKELQQAVAYFDSLTFTLNNNHHTSWCHCERLVSLSNHDSQSSSRNDNTVFLDARAHYINGAGFYENDSVIEACAEYLTALKTVEKHCHAAETKDFASLHPVHLPLFLCLTYTHLGELFSEQFMTEPAIACYKNAFLFCKKEPTSPYGSANTLYRIGIQYDILGEKDSANYYYTKAIETLPDTTNLPYRDMVSSLALLEYQLNHEARPALQRLKQMVALTDNKEEKLTRYAAIGHIFFEEKVYDSALLYLESVFECKSNDLVRIQAAKYLCDIYDSIGLPNKADVYIRFLAKNKPIVADEEAKVSQLNTLFQDYWVQKRERNIMEEKAHERKMATKSTTTILIPILLAIVFLTFLALRKRYMNNLLEKEVNAKQHLEAENIKHQNALLLQQAEAEKRIKANESRYEQELEAQRKELEERDKKHAESLEFERQAHRLQQAALSSKLKKSNEVLRDTSKQLEKALAEKGTSEPLVLARDYASFKEVPVCQQILKTVQNNYFKSKMDCLVYKEHALSKEQLQSLRDAADVYMAQFTIRLRKRFPKLTDEDMSYCCLYLLGLNEAAISALMQKAYPTVCERNRKIRRIIGAKGNLTFALCNL